MENERGKVFLYDEKVRAKMSNMTRIIFLGGNRNRRQDIFKACRRAPGPSEDANMDQEDILCDDMFWMKNSCGNVEYMTRFIFLGDNLNRQQDIFKSCRGAPGPSEHANMVQNMFYVTRFLGRKSSPENVEYMTSIIFLGGNLNRRPDLMESCRGIWPK